MRVCVCSDYDCTGQVIRTIGKETFQSLNAASNHESTVYMCFEPVYEGASYYMNTEPSI